MGDRRYANKEKGDHRYGWRPKVRRKSIGDHKYANKTLGDQGTLTKHRRPKVRLATKGTQTKAKATKVSRGRGDLPSCLRGPDLNTPARPSIAQPSDLHAPNWTITNHMQKSVDTNVASSERTILEEDGTLQRLHTRACMPRAACTPGLELGVHGSDDARHHRRLPPLTRGQTSRKTFPMH
jgi:hypothetical protein